MTSELASAALAWLAAAARPVDGPGGELVWTGSADEREPDPTLYSGGAGIVLTFLAASSATGDERWGELAQRGGRGVAAAVDAWPDSSLHFGLAGMAVALDEVGTHLDDVVCRAAAARARDRIRSLFDGERWNEMSELLVGNAGIGLAALAIGDLELALTAVEPYLRWADETAGGVNWAVRPSPARSHHVAHGTLGIVLALTRVGVATGRTDLLDLAVAGAADVVSRNEAGADGFLVPHSDPPHRPELIERWSLGWCNGPAGDAQVFRALTAATGDPRWQDLGDRCWHSVTTSGLPTRRRPGFWDNNGRCCGTAGVLALATARLADGRPDDGFGQVLVDDLASRATVDGDGARWSNVEHRATPSGLTPRHGWAMGNAGIALELLRGEGVRLPGQRWAVTGTSDLGWR